MRDRSGNDAAVEQSTRLYRGLTIKNTALL